VNLDTITKQAGMSAGAPTALGALARGAIAGVAGTAMMTACQTLSARLLASGCGDSDGDSGGDAGTDAWEQAPAPAKVAERIVEGVFQRTLPARRIDLATSVMHWSYGTSCGLVYGALSASTPTAGGPRRGMAFGAGVWLMSYVELVPLGLYGPPWKEPLKELAMDLSYHLAYGLGVGTTYRLLDRR
jgi:hypothetical protein